MPSAQIRSKRALNRGFISLKAMVLAPRKPQLSASDSTGLPRPCTVISVPEPKELTHA
jgi:hypothetical protein